MAGADNSNSKTSGFIVLDKPEGLSSMTAIAILRRKAGGLKTGHAGTLDPLATGVLMPFLVAKDAVDDAKAALRAHKEELAAHRRRAAEGVRSSRLCPQPTTPAATHPRAGGRAGGGGGAGCPGWL